ncbi:hypothetical protein ACW2AB_11195 [Limosilactobacillus fermentum]
MQKRVHDPNGTTTSVTCRQTLNQRVEMAGMLAGDAITQACSRARVGIVNDG